MTSKTYTSQPFARILGSAVTVIATVLLSACTLAPKESRPDLDIPSAFKESAALRSANVSQNALGRWTPANPADQQHPSSWWKVFKDPILERLEEEALRANPDVAIGIARIKQARALLLNSEASRVPEVNAGFSATRQRTSGAALGLGNDAAGVTQTLWRGQALASYEVDIFGRVSSQVAASAADAKQQEALTHQMLLMIQADVASTYFNFRQLEGELRLLRDTVTLRQNAASLLERKLNDGAVASYVVDQAKTELYLAQAERLTAERQHALTLHALAILLGKPPADFSMESQPLESITVQLPPGIPSDLLKRRPDIAAAQQAMAAENARIGVAKAALFPSLSLTGALGYESAELGHLAHWFQRTFLLGPLLSLPIFDGGRRDAGVARAKAIYEESVAQYRKAVLHAFREVEDALASLRTLDERIAYQRGAEQASTRVAKSANARFDEGDVDYLSVVDAERTMLRSRQSLIQSEGERARATVELVRALGGGWASSSDDKSADHS